MQNLDPYLTFDGTCADAMRFYQQTLGGKLELLTLKETLPPDQVPEGAGHRIMHSRLTVPGGVIMASDSQVGMPYKGMHGFSISLLYKDVEEGRRIFEALADGGRVTMPFGETFWAQGFGMCADRFGTPWMVSGGENKE